MPPQFPRKFLPAEHRTQKFVRWLSPSFAVQVQGWWSLVVTYPPKSVPPVVRNLFSSQRSNFIVYVRRRRVLCPGRNHTYLRRVTMLISLHSISYRSWAYYVVVFLLSERVMMYIILSGVFRACDRVSWFLVPVFEPLDSAHMCLSDSIKPFKINIWSIVAGVI